MSSKKTLLLAVSCLISLSQAPCVLSQDAGVPPPSSSSTIVPTPDYVHLAPPDSTASSGERWDELSLRGTEFDSKPIIVGEVDELPGFTRELLRVQWRNGDPIDLYIVRPAGVAKPPVIVYLYGYPGEAVRFLNNSLCKTVTKNGFAAIGFSSMLTGQRYHDVPMNEWFVSDLPRSLVGTTHDVQMVLNYLTDRGDFDLSRVGIFGEGSGGTIALLAASVDPRIKAVDVLNPWGDWRSWLAASALVPDAERADYLKPAFLNSAAPFDPVNVLPRRISVPLRLQQNLWDDTKIPAIAMQHITAALPADATLAQYKNEQEYFDKVGNSGKMLDWMYSKLAHSAGESAASPKSPWGALELQHSFR
jgi:hypothetical protein